MKIRFDSDKTRFDSMNNYLTINNNLRELTIKYYFEAKYAKLVNVYLFLK